MTLEQEIQKKLDSKEGRLELLRKISDDTMLGPVGELTKSLVKKGDEENAKKVVEFENGAIYLIILGKLAIGKIRKFEGD